MLEFCIRNLIIGYIFANFLTLPTLVVMLYVVMLLLYCYDCIFMTMITENVSRKLLNYNFVMWNLMFMLSIIKW